MCCQIGRALRHAIRLESSSIAGVFNIICFLVLGAITYKLCGVVGNEFSVNLFVALTYLFAIGVGCLLCLYGIDREKRQKVNLEIAPSDTEKRS